jgi:bifunctional DNase/RNase
MFEMIVKQLGISPLDGHSVVLLKEKNGQRVMPIWVGPIEFNAIALAMKQVVPSRPQTHDLMINAINAVGCKVARLEIVNIADSTFYAKLCLSGRNNEDITVDCRPSDGIALALRQSAPILVSPEVAEAAAYPETDATGHDAGDEFKNFLKNLKASDFAKLSQTQPLPEDAPAVLPETAEAGDREEGDGIVDDGANSMRDDNPKTNEG